MTSRLRQRLAEADVLRILGVHDGFTARLGERAGFDALWASGLGISASYGLPDAGLLGIAEFLDRADMIGRATRLPVIADCDSGFGDVNVVSHLARGFAHRGVAAICLEDKAMPKRNSFRPDQRLADPHEFAAKLTAAKRAGDFADLLVIARVEALVSGLTLDEALARARLYASCGADAIVIHSKADAPDEVLAFARAWRREPRAEPLVVIPTTYPGVTVEELCDHGVRAVIYANQVLRAMQQAVASIAAEIHAAGSSAQVEARIASLSDVFDLIGAGAIEDADRTFALTVAKLREEHPVDVREMAA